MRLLLTIVVALCGCSPGAALELGGDSEPSDEELLHGSWVMIVSGTGCGLVTAFGVTPSGYGEIKFCAIDDTRAQWQEIHGIYSVSGAIMTMTPKVSSCFHSGPYQRRFEVYEDSLRLYFPGSTTSILLERSPDRPQRTSDGTPGSITEYGCFRGDGSFASQALAPTGL